MMRRTKIMKTIIGLIASIICGFALYGVYLWASVQVYNVKTLSEYGLISVEKDNDIQQKFIAQSNYLCKLGIYLVDTDEKRDSTFEFQILNDKGKQVFQKEYPSSIIQTGEINYFDINLLLVKNSEYTLKMTSSQKDNSSIYSMVMVPKKNVAVTGVLSIAGQPEYTNMVLNYTFMDKLGVCHLFILIGWACFGWILIALFFSAKIKEYMQSHISHRKYIFAAGTALSYSCFFISLFVNPTRESSMTNLLQMLLLLFAMLIEFVMYVFMRFHWEAGRDLPLLKQLMIMQVLRSCSTAMILFGNLNQLLTDRFSYVLLAGLLLESIGITSFSIFILYKKNKLLIQWKKTIAYLWCNKWFIISLFVMILLSMDTVGGYLRWDSSQYVKDLAGWQCSDIFSANGLRMCGHMSFAYKLIIIVIDSVLHDVVVSLQIINILLMSLSSICFYGIVKYYLKDREARPYWLDALIYMSAPFVLGLVGNISTDYPMMCFFIILYYFVLKKQYVFQALCTFALCFSKEPGIILTAALYGGILLQDCLKDGIKGFGKRLKDLLKPQFLIGIAVVFVVMLGWILTFFSMDGGWGKNASATENTFMINPAYILEKLKVILFLNTNWLFTCIVLVLFIWVLYKKEYKLVHQLIPLGACWVADLAFNLLYVTVNNPRYMCIYISIIYLLFVLLLEYVVTRGALKNIILVLCAGLLMIQNYRTVDPLSRPMLNVMDIGSTRMVTPRKYGLDDSIVYSRQYSYLDKAMQSLLTDIMLEDSDSMILMPAGTSKVSASWNMAGVSEMKIYWNKKTSRINYLKQGKEIDLHYMSDKTVALPPYEEGQKIWYIYLPSQYPEINDRVHTFTGADYVDSKTAEAGGWIVQAECYNTGTK